MAKKIIFILVLAIFASQALMIHADQPDAKTLKKIEKLVKKGDKSVKKQDFPKAMEYYNKALELNNEAGIVYHHIAVAHQAQKQYDEAIGNLEKALKYQPDLAPAAKTMIQMCMGMAQMNIKKRDYAKANEYYLKLANPVIEKADAKIYLEATYNVGINYFLLKKPAESNEYMKKVLAFPDLKNVDKAKFVNANYQIGANSFNMKKLEDVEKYMGTLLEVEGLKEENLKLYTFANYLIGVASKQLGKLEQSSKYLKEYIQVTQNNTADPYAPLANFMLGSNYYELLQKQIAPIQKDKELKDKATKIAEVAKNFADVVPYLSKAIELDPKLEPAYLNLGNYYYMCRDYANATKTYETMIEKFPTSPDVDSYTKFLEDIKKAAEDKGKKKK